MISRWFPLCTRTTRGIGKYQFYRFWFDLNRDQAHDLTHTMLTITPRCHFRGSSMKVWVFINMIIHLWCLKDCGFGFTGSYRHIQQFFSYIVTTRLVCCLGRKIWEVILSQPMKSPAMGTVGDWVTGRKLKSVVLGQLELGLVAYISRESYLDWYKISNNCNMYSFRKLYSLHY